MKKISFILPIAMIAALASCGGPSSNGGEANLNQVEFSFWYTVGQGLQEGIAEQADAFTKIVKEKEGVDVKIELSYEGGYNDIQTKISQGFGSSNIPSLAVAYPDHVASYLYSKKDAVVNLDNYLNDAKIGFGTEKYLGDFTSSSEDGKCSKDDIVKTFYEEGQHYAVKGTYSLPWMKSSEILFYNLDAVKRCFDLGVTKTGETFDASIKTEEDVINFVESMSWDEMMSLSAFAKDHKATVLPNMVTPVMYDSDSNLFITKMYQENIPYASVTDDGKGKIDFQNGDSRNKAEDFVARYAKYATDGLLTTKILQEDKYSSSFFTEEQVIFAIGSSGGTGYNSPQGATFNYRIAKVPASNNNPLYITQGPSLTLLKETKKGDTPEMQEQRTKYAWKFMKYLTNTDMNTELCIADSQGYIPVRESSYQTEDFSAFLEEPTIFSDAARVLLNDVAGNYIVSESFNGSSVLRAQVGNIIAKVVGGDTVSNAIDMAINEAMKAF